MAALFSSSRAAGRPLRKRLLLLAASGLLPLVLVMAWGLNYLLEDRQEEVERGALEISRALAAAVNAELRSTVTLLEHIGTADELEGADLRLFHENLQRTAAQLGWLQVALSDAQGLVLLRTNEPYGTSVPLSVEPISAATVIQTRTPYVSQVFRFNNPRVDAFAVRVPVLRSGELVYILSGVLPTQVIGNVLTRQNIPTSSIVSVFDQADYSVARSRAMASPAPSPTLKLVLAQGGGQGTGSATAHDGHDYNIGFTRLPASGWSVVVGTPVAEASKALYALLGAVALGLAASLGLSALLAWVLSRRVMAPIDALIQGAAALGRGGPVKLPPLDVAELNGIALALNEAAADRDRAAAQITDALRVAEEANSSKDQFLAVLGHELRNPLAPIATAVQLMALKGDDKTANERRIIERQLGHVTRLVDDLLDVSRITSGRLAIRREPLRIDHLLAQLVESIRPSLNQRALSLALEPGMQDAWVAGDEVRLTQVFNNLLVNAIKFTPAGGSIRVTARRVEGTVQVDVQDTGVGLSPQEVARIFELFYQAPQSTDRSRGGLGLGLPIVRSLVGMHGGTVRADSAGPGQGTCLTVALPLCPAPADTPEHALKPAVEGEGQVLVVDDNEDAAITCAGLLEMSGYTVRVAHSPEETFHVLQEFTPDVAILDIGLPGMSGHELAQRMKSAPIGYGGRLVALTGYGQASDMAASRAAGFDAHLTKPVAPGDLLALVDTLVRRGS